MANIFEFLSKDGNITPEKVRKSRQMQFRDKTAYLWGLRYRWAPLLSMNPVRQFAHFMPSWLSFVCFFLPLWLFRTWDSITVAVVYIPSRGAQLINRFPRHRNYCRLFTPIAGVGERVKERVEDIVSTTSMLREPFKNVLADFVR